MNTTKDILTDALLRAAQSLSEASERRYGVPLSSEQIDALYDPARAVEAYVMLDDLEARCDLDVSAVRAALMSLRSFEGVRS